MVVLHGDWHILQLIDEILGDILWDEELKQLCYEYDPTQWQKVHILSLALHETVLRKAVLYYTKSSKCDHLTPNYHEFTKWRNRINQEANSGETSKFWASIMSFLNVYVATIFL